ncbi:hypothetical protein MTO96_018509 [Rhipicephalus appendiculatus]
MKAVILSLPLLAALSTLTQCGLPPPVGRDIKHGCPAYCEWGQQHGEPCGPGCTCRQHMRIPGAVMCVGIHAKSPYHVRPWRPGQRN